MPDNPDFIRPVRPDLVEGYWRWSATENSPLPWPEGGEAWLGKEHFLEQLRRMEGAAHPISYRGLSICRLCGILNGSREFWHDGWLWPEGFAHYVEEHNVRPSPAFDAFIAKAGAHSSEV